MTATALLEHMPKLVSN